MNKCLRNTVTHLAYKSLTEYQCIPTQLDRVIQTSQYFMSDKLTLPMYNSRRPLFVSEESLAESDNMTVICLRFLSTCLVFDIPPSAIFKGTWFVISTNCKKNSIAFFLFKQSDCNGYYFVFPFSSRMGSLKNPLSCQITTSLTTYFSYTERFNDNTLTNADCSDYTIKLCLHMKKKNTIYKQEGPHSQQCIIILHRLTSES